LWNGYMNVEDISCWMGNAHLFLHWEDKVRRSSQVGWVGLGCIGVERLIQHEVNYVCMCVKESARKRGS
jgi:hypothetical protein